MFRLILLSGLIILVLLTSLSLAGIPKMINYQGMLTDNSGNPLTGSYNLTFKIWTDTTGGSSLWNETQNGVQVQQGLFNVILGMVNALNLPFDQQYWLEVKVGTETMPRIRFTSVGYAYRASVADTAYVAAPGGDMDARYVNVSGPDSMSGSSARPMMRVVNYGATGGGIHIDTAGSYGMRIQAVGTNGIYMDDIHGDGIHMRGMYGNGIYGDTIFCDGIFIRKTGCHGLELGHVGWAGAYVDSADYDGFQGGKVGRNGFNVARAHKHGLFVGQADTDGVHIGRAGNGVMIDTVLHDGLHVTSAGNHGIDAWGNWGNILASAGSISYGLQVLSEGLIPYNPGLYVYGTFVATGTKASVVPTSLGYEPLFAIETPEVEFMASGHASLVNGQAQVAFERLFQEAISPDIPLKIMLTPKGGWSGLYVGEQSSSGFSVKSGAGEQNIEFDWLAIGRRKGYETRPQVKIPEDMTRERPEGH